MKLFYRDTGQGVPVLILHGLYGSSDSWMTIARMLSGQYRIIIPDLRNHGKSPHDPVHTYEVMVTDLAGLFHELDIEKVHLLGHSMGGKLAMAFAADYPDKILSLTVADIAPKNYLKSPASDIHFLQHNQLLEFLSSMDMNHYSSRKEIENALAKAIPDRMIRMFIMKNLKRAGNAFEWKVNAPVLLKSLDHILSAITLDEYSDRIPFLSYPVLFINGALSGYIRNSDEALLHKMYPDSRLVEMKGASHFLHTEDPEGFVQILTGFYSSFYSLQV